ncbi:MAG: hypothetical protein FWD26_03015 [Treponema sp.]|nr:hypothetical protein [Treponema sp.]
MTFKEKSKEKTSALTGIYTFSDVVDKACDNLMECQIKYSIRRLLEMEEFLCCLEQELDEFLAEHRNEKL